LSEKTEGARIFPLMAAGDWLLPGRGGAGPERFPSAWVPRTGGRSGSLADPGLKRGAKMTTRTPFIESPGGWFGGQAVLDGPHLTIRRPDPGQ
jgi:hypothetical protein